MFSGWGVPIETDLSESKDAGNVEHDSEETESSVEVNEQKLQNTSVTDKYKTMTKQQENKHVAVAYGAQSLKKGITSSPSFQELERAIGDTLALGLNSDSDQNLEQRGKNQPLSKNSSSPRGRQSHLYVQQYHFSPPSPRHHFSSYPIHESASESSSLLDTRSQLAPFINESDSRALIMFHSPSISPVVVRDACQKYGVLYYMRPEFHSKGVTFLSYFDQRSATAAHNGIPGDLERDSGSSVHFSVMLHAANNSDESRLVIRNLPSGNEFSVYRIK